MAIQNRMRPPASPRSGTPSSELTARVKTMRMATAAAVPSTMPAIRWRGGRVRQASAMTTALSPASTMSTPMILQDRKGVLAQAERFSDLVEAKSRSCVCDHALERPHRLT